jgi:Multiubiquitin
MNDDKGKHKKFEIKIDRDKFEVEGPTITGAQLRALPNPLVGPDRDLFLTAPGPDPDLLIKDDQIVELKEGMHFFTAPANITPGGNAGAD